MKRKLSNVAVLFTVMVLGIMCGFWGEQAFRQQYDSFHRSLRWISKEEREFRYTRVTPLEFICPAEYPPVHPTLHDRRPDQTAQFYQAISSTMLVKNGKANGDDIPEVQVLHNQKFAVWKMFKHFHTQASVWEDIDEGDGQMVRTALQGAGWRDPIHPDIVPIELEGDYAAFTSWFLGNFAHFMHDHLPTIAYLKSIVPETTKFLLVDNPTSHKIMEFLDPAFYKRICWIPRDKAYYIPGSLTVAIPQSHPITYGCCGGWDPLREWLARSHPDYHTRDEDRLVVFYSRQGGSAEHGRVMECKHEQEVQKHIQAAMVRHGRKEHFVVFTGKDRNGVLPMIQQFSIFRSASTIIGPHGSGIGGNFVWTNPFASSCQERTKLLEFIPGPDSAYVHSKYASHYDTIRRWPLDYHQILYTKESTSDTTYINLQDLDDALDAMWGNPSTM